MIYCTSPFQGDLCADYMTVAAQAHHAAALGGASACGLSLGGVKLLTDTEIMIQYIVLYLNGISNIAVNSYGTHVKQVLTIFL